MSIRVAVFSTGVCSSDTSSTLISSTTISSESSTKTFGSGSISVENNSSSASNLALSSICFGCSSGVSSGVSIISGFVISLKVSTRFVNVSSFSFSSLDNRNSTSIFASSWASLSPENNSVISDFSILGTWGAWT